MVTNTKIQLLGGIVVLAVNTAGEVLTSSTICTGMSQSSLSSILFNTSSTGPVLEHIATSHTSLFPTREALSSLLNQGSNFLGSSPSYIVIESNNLSNSCWWVFSTNCPKAVP